MDAVTFVINRLGDVCLRVDVTMVCLVSVCWCIVWPCITTTFGVHRSWLGLSRLTLWDLIEAMCSCPGIFSPSLSLCLSLVCCT